MEMRAEVDDLGESSSRASPGQPAATLNRDGKERVRGQQRESGIDILVSTLPRWRSCGGNKAVVDEEDQCLRTVCEGYAEAQGASSQTWQTAFAVGE
eukprot:6261128-Amphidinium_carterae.2